MKLFKKSKYILSSFLIVLAFSSCSSDESNDCQSESSLITVANERETTCKGSAWYTVTFKANLDRVNGQKLTFSAMTGMTHNNDVILWRVGKEASQGVECLVETGETSALDDEMKKAIENKDGGQIVSMKALNTQLRQTQREFAVSTAYSMVSLLARINPSSDGFVGVSDLDFCYKDTWIERKEIELSAFDAGTNTSEREPIEPLNKKPFTVNGTPLKLGTLTFVKKN